MNPKAKKIEMHKLFCLCNLLLESLDDLKPTNPMMLKFKDDLIGMCELLNNEVNDTFTIQKSTYFPELSNKIATLVRKNFNPEM